MQLTVSVGISRHLRIHISPGAERSAYQFWFYYPGSATGEGSTPLKRPIRSVSKALGNPSYHPDDWEYQ